MNNIDEQLPKVSVLMPVYNAQKYIAEAIESITNQTFTDWELIIVNDGSTDESEKIIRQFKDDRIYYINNDLNLGLINTLNRGIKLCKGEYIARMDADDISLSNRIEKQVDFLDKNSEYVMCGTNAIVIDEKGKEYGKIINLEDDNYLRINLLFSNPFVHPSIMLRKDILPENLFDTNYKHVEDYELWCRLSKYGKLYNIQENLLFYRRHNTNVSILNDEEQEIKKDSIIINNLKSFGINATADDLNIHKVTFQLYQLGNKLDKSVYTYKAIDNWFFTIKEQSKRKKVYKQSDLIAYLWSRWIVLCISQKKYQYIFSPKFVCYNPIVLIKTLKLILFLTKKR